MRKPMIAGNWKMNGDTKRAKLLCREVAVGASVLVNVDISVFPPYILIPVAASVLKDSSIKLGAQDVDIHHNGAYTGQISGQMLINAGCRYVIVGHSERRTIYKENNELVALKVKSALSNHLTVIFCLGETEKERKFGQTNQVVSRQLESLIESTGIEAFSNIVIAYEPVWAIGTRMTPTPSQVQQVHATLRKHLSLFSTSIADGCRIIYGGSVEPKNAKQLISEPDVDGGLIGASSLKSEDFLKICRSACYPIY